VIENLEGETWVDIKGYEGYYQVSNLGRIKRLPSVVQFGSATRRLGGVRSLHVGTTGYYSVGLAVLDKKKTEKVHILCAKSFIPNPYPNTHRYVNHIDKKCLNNSLGNLEWCTNRYNSIHGDRNKDSTYGLLFVSYAPNYSSINPYKAAIRVGKSTKSKCFNNPLEAHRWAAQFLDPKELLTYRYNFDNPSVPIEVNHWDTYIK
jgi:hypothetical protein